MEAALETFKAHFSHLEDPRVNPSAGSGHRVHNQLHNLEDILILTILAVLCGANDWVEIEEFGKSKLEWLTHSAGSGQETVLELRNGIPSHDTLGRVFSLLDPAQLQDGFLRWISSLAKLDGEFLAVDGKTLRRAYETGKRKGAIHISTSSVHRMVSAWGVTNHLVFGQLRTAEK